MKAVALWNQKGGVGKTDLVLQLAAAGMVRGERVGIIDVDPQGSAALWAKRRKDAGRPAPAIEQPPEGAALDGWLPGRVDAARRAGVGLLLIDTPPRLDESARAIAQAAGLVLVPVPPRPTELDAARGTLLLLYGAGLRDRTHAIITMAGHRVAGFERRAVTRAGEALRTAYRASVCPVILRDWAIHGESVGDGGSVVEAEPQSKAAADVNSLLEWVLSHG